MSGLSGGPVTVDRLASAGVHVLLDSVFCEDEFNGARSLERTRRLLGFRKDRMDVGRLAASPQELLDINKNNEAFGFLRILDNADSLAGDLSVLDTFREEGVGIVGLTGDGTNRLADGRGIVFSEGLTPRGRDVLKAVVREGLLLDVSRLHPHGLRQVFDLYEGPLVATSAGLRSVSPVPGNLNMEEAREIAERGGVIGVSFDPALLRESGEAGVEDVFIHMDELVQRFGPACSGVGSGFGGNEKFAAGLEDITGLGALKEIMLDHGYGEEASEAILGDNWLRVLTGGV